MDFEGENHPWTCDTEELLQPLSVLHLHPCCTNNYTAGTSESLRILGSHCNKVNMMVKICTIPIAGQPVWAAVHNIFTNINKRQLIESADCVFAKY